MTRTLMRLLLVLVVTPCALTPANAQSSDTMPNINMVIGAPVRVVARDTTHVIVGTFARQAADTFVLHRSAGANDTTVFLRNLLRVDEQAHPFSTPATRRGALVGGVVGLAAGVLIIQKAQHDCHRSSLQSLTIDPSCLVDYTSLPSFIGAGAGLGFGFAWLSDEPRWQVRWSSPLP